MESTPNELRVLVLGMGAIGTYIGGSLALAGNSVTYIEKPEVAKGIDCTKLSIGIKGRVLQIPEIKIATSVEEAIMMNSYDIGILAVKSFDTSSIIDGIRSQASQFPPILCLQNGVENEGILAQTLGTGKVIAGTVTTAVGKTGVGQIVVEKLRGIGIALNHPFSQRLIDAFNRAGLKTTGYSNAQGMKWSKLLTNLLANASSALLDMPPAVIFAHPGLFKVETSMIKEALAVMQALNIAVVDLPNTPVRALVGIIQNLPQGISQPLLFQALGKGRGGKMPSFHIDLYSGRQKSEVEFLNGAVVRFGKQVNVPTPVNDWLTRVLLKMSIGALPKETLAHQPDKYLEWVGQGRLQ